MQITFNFSELWFIFCLGQPKSILKKALSRPLHFKSKKISALFKDLYRNLRTFQWLPLIFKDFSRLCQPWKRWRIKLQRYISTFFGQRDGPRENTRGSHEAASKTSHSRVSFRQPRRSRVACPNVGDWIRVESELPAEFHMNSAASSSSDALFFAQRRVKNGSDWWQSAKDHEKEKEERRSAVSPVFSFPPSFAKTFSSRERERPLGTKQWTVFKKHLTRRDLSSYYKYHVTGNACP